MRILKKLINRFYDEATQIMTWENKANLESEKKYRRAYAEGFAKGMRIISDEYEKMT